MPWLKIYDKERGQFPEFRKKFVPRNQIGRILRGLSNYFGFRNKPTVLYTTRGKGYAECYWDRIRLAKNKLPSLGMTIHEFAHLLNYKLYKGVGHSGRFYDCLCRVYRAAKIKKYLERCVDSDELDPKPTVSEPTSVESIITDIQQIT